MISERTSRIALGVALLGSLGWSSASVARETLHLRAQEPGQQGEEKPQEKPAATQVKIDNFSFEPREITVAAGTTVVWTNRDDVPHTVTSSNDKFGSKALDTDDAFSFTFKDPGKYEYYCSVHPKMTGTVIVK